MGCAIDDLITQMTLFQMRISFEGLIDILLGEFLYSLVVFCFFFFLEGSLFSCSVLHFVESCIALLSFPLICFAVFHLFIFPQICFLLLMLFIFSSFVLLCQSCLELSWPVLFCFILALLGLVLLLYCLA